MNTSPVQANVKMGFVYEFEQFRNGVLIDKWTAENLMPDDALTYVARSSMDGVTDISTWYIGLYKAAYTPVGTETAALIPGTVVEFTSYSETTRPAWTKTYTSGVLTNTASKAVFTSSLTGMTTETIYGVFISSAPAKNASTGTLLSIAAYSPTKVVGAGDVLNVTAAIQLQRA